MAMLRITIPRKILIFIIIIIMVVLPLFLISKYSIDYRKPLNTPYAFLGAYAEYNFTSYDRDVLYKLNASRVSGIRRYEIVSVNTTTGEVTVRLTMERFSVTYPNGTTVTYTGYSEIREKIPYPYVFFLETEVPANDVMALMPWMPPDKLGGGRLGNV